jgi:hypothetical protein
MDDSGKTTCVDAARKLLAEQLGFEIQNFVRYKNSEACECLLSGSPVSMVMLEDGGCMVPCLKTPFQLFG